MSRNDPVLFLTVANKQLGNFVTSDRTFYFILRLNSFFLIRFHVNESVETYTGMLALTQYYISFSFYRPILASLKRQSANAIRMRFNILDGTSTDTYSDCVCFAFLKYTYIQI